MDEPVTFPAHRQFLLSLLFDEDHYRSQRFLDTLHHESPIDHYVRIGWRHGLDPSSTFRSSRYLNATAGLRQSGQNPFLHYLFETVGEAVLAKSFTGLNMSDVRRLRSAFDANWYLVRYPDVEESGYDPFIEYMSSGWRRANDPSRQFSTQAYLDRYIDINDSGINPFQHYVLHGLAEGRTGDGPKVAFSSWESLNPAQKSLLSQIFLVDYYYLPFSGTGIDRGTAMAQYICSLSSSGSHPTPSFRALRYRNSRPGLFEVERLPFLAFLFGDVGENALRSVFSALSEGDVQRLCDEFDAAWYLYSYPDIEISGQDAFIHYMTVGWQERRDPSPAFSTSAYLLRYPDIADCGMNPFLHWVLFGKSEGRTGQSSSSNFRNRPYTPSVTAILVNRAFDPITRECLEAVLRQSYPDLTVVIVGDPPPENGLAATAQSEALGHERMLSYPLGEDAHWSWTSLQRVVERATGDLLWIVQRPAVHDVDFLARLTSSFADNSVQLGFGRALQRDDEDAIGQNRLLLQTDGWKRHSVRPAAIWFPDQLKPEPLAAQQSSFLWRRRQLDADIWRQAGTYRYLGFWYLYLHMASGGQIASVRDALVHTPPEPMTASRPLDDPEFYDDIGRFAIAVGSFWTIDPTVRDISAKAFSQQMGSGAMLPDTILRKAGSDVEDGGSGKRHVLIVTHGIFAGGAENFPIQLANELARFGIIVSMLIFKTDDVNAEMRATLDPGVSIYEAEWVLEYGCRQFVEDIGCSLIHSHGVVSEMFFFGRCDCAPNVAYIATLHGSYEASTSKDLPEVMIAKIVRNIDLFVYTADKNLKPLLRHGVQPAQLVKLSNAMPVDETPFPLTRADMGIADDAVIFTLVARGIKEKGWSTAIKSFKAVQKMNPDRKMHLCLVGEGDEPDRLGPSYTDDSSISFLGFQLRIHGLYRMTDVAIVPTRFAGESFPLCIIQALQVSVPVIATDVGEIASMLRDGEVVGGIVLKNEKIDKAFEAAFATAMNRLLDDDYRKGLSAAAGLLGKGYDMDGLTRKYIDLYDDTIHRLHPCRGTSSQNRDDREAVETV